MNTKSLSVNKIRIAFRRAVEHDFEQRMFAAQVSRRYQTTAWEDSCVIAKEEEAINAVRSNGLSSEEEVTTWLSEEGNGEDLVGDACSALIAAIDAAAKNGKARPLSNRAASSGTERERLCTAIMMAHIGREIDDWKEVKSFRWKLFQGQMLEEEAAWKLITQEIFQVLDFDHLQQHENPMKMCGEITIREPLAAGKVSFHVRFGEAERGQRTASVVHEPETLAVLAHHGGRAALSYVHFFDEVNDLLVESGGAFFRSTHSTHLKIRGYWPSVAGRALEITHCIGRAYGWQARDALRFLLIGQLPTDSLYAVSTPNHWYNDLRKRGIIGPVCIMVSPWTQPETLEKLYTERVLTIAGSDGKPLVQSLPSEAKLRLYQVIVDQTPIDKPPAWARICRSEAFLAWRQRHSPNSAAGSWRGMAKNAFDRVGRYLARWNDPLPCYWPLREDEP